MEGRNQGKSFNKSNTCLKQKSYTLIKRNKKCRQNIIIKSCIHKNTSYIEGGQIPLSTSWRFSGDDSRAGPRDDDLQVEQDALRLFRQSHQTGQSEPQRNEDLIHQKSIEINFILVFYPRQQNYN